MIEVTMQLRSAISPSRDALLCKVVIVNDGTGTATRGNYDWRVLGRKGQTIKSGRLEKWPRQSKSTGQLLHAVMDAAYGAKS